MRSQKKILLLSFQYPLVDSVLHVSWLVEAEIEEDGTPMQLLCEATQHSAISAGKEF